MNKKKEDEGDDTDEIDTTGRHQRNPSEIIPNLLMNDP